MQPKRLQLGLDALAYGLGLGKIFVGPANLSDRDWRNAELALDRRELPGSEPAQTGLLPP
jgi:hypothetical protein